MTANDLANMLRLDEGPRRILVVEDAPDHYRAMLAWLARGGHDAVAFAEIHEIREGRLTGLTLEGEPATVGVEDLDIAFLDFYFPSEPWNGGRLARALIAAHPQIRVFGMSSVASKNGEMVRQGALGGLLKRELGRLIES